MVRSNEDHVLKPFRGAILSEDLPFERQAVQVRDWQSRTCKLITQI